MNVFIALLLMSLIICTAAAVQHVLVVRPLCGKHPVQYVCTTGWAVQPEPYYCVRIGAHSYVCIARIWRWALIQQLGE